MAKKKSVRNAGKALKIAREVVKEATSWTEAYNKLFGVGAAFSELFTGVSDRTAFASSAEHKAIMDMLEQLRNEQGDPTATIAEQAEHANGKILVRLPKTLHAALLMEAKSECVSLNQLCLAKLALRIQMLS